LGLPAAIVKDIIVDLVVHNPLVANSFDSIIDQKHFAFGCKGVAIIASL